MKLDDLYTTGEIAKMAGISLRTIRYYDIKGVLAPSKYTDSGHRLYSYDDYMKLKKILALKYLGFSLDDVITTEKSDFSRENVVKLLKIQHSIIQNKINHMKSVLEAIETAESCIGDDGNIDWTKTVDIIKILKDEREMHQKYLYVSNLNAETKLKNSYSSNNNNWYKWLFKKINFYDKSRVLEIGCGNGVLWSKNINKLNKTTDITLTEVSEDILNETKKNLNKHDIKYFNFDVIDPNNIPYNDDSFDIIIANHILFYIKNIDTVLKEIQRVLKTGGRLYCTTIDSNYLKELEELLTKFNSRKINFTRQKLINNFGAINGKQLLNKYFHNVIEYTYDEKLIINNSDVILDYIYSMPESYFKDIVNKKNDFERYIEQCIEKNGDKGFYITNSSILFVSEKL